MEDAENILKKRIILFAIISVLVTVFILGNSLQTSEVSNGISGGISGFLYRLPLICNNMDEESFHKLVRKSAHFAEFAALGLCTAAAAYFAGELKRNKYVSATLLAGLLVAVCDEFIQSFTGRTSSVRDVLLDFSGAVFGACVTVIYVRFLRKRRND